MRNVGAIKVAFDAYVPATDTVLYTYAGTLGGRAEITNFSFAQVSGTPSLILRRVPAGGTITDEKYRFCKVTLAADETFYGSADGDDDPIVLRNGESLVGIASGASEIAGRVEVREFNG